MSGNGQQVLTVEQRNRRPNLTVINPMAICPHCKADEIGILEKLLASESCPARCPSCGRNSTLSPFVAHLLVLVCFFAWLLVALFSLIQSSNFLFLTGSGLLGGVYTVFLLLLPLVPIRRGDFNVDR
jgi:hypothetical protein